MAADGNTFGQGEQTLSRAAGMVAGAKTDFDKLSSQLDSHISHLRGKWQGAGGQAFFVLHQAWTEKQKLIVSALNEFEASLRSTEKDNYNTDGNVQTSSTRLQNRLSGVH